MWRWERGRLEYFQFDVLRRMAQFALTRETDHDLPAATHGELEAAIGLPFDPPDRVPWRNYQRVFRRMFIVAGQGTPKDPARATPVAKLLAEAGLVTADEFFHFIAQATTEPSPALRSYNNEDEPRFPLLFALKYILAKSAEHIDTATSFDEVIGAYLSSGFTGDESDLDFIALLKNGSASELTGANANPEIRRDARESMLVLSQISYLHVVNQQIVASIAPDDAHDAFKELAPLLGIREKSASLELERRASFFKEGSTLDFFDYPKTVVSELVQAGFEEGTKVEKTHLVIERNAKLRAEYFKQFEPIACDICGMDTHATYPWTDRVLELHHKLPLSSGTRTEETGTVFGDLVPVCPSCHRSVHRFYGSWLRDQGRKDFDSAKEADATYMLIKEQFGGHKYA